MKQCEKNSNNNVILARLKFLFLVLGLYHEHQRPDRDNYISVGNSNNVTKCPLTNINVRQWLSSATTDYHLGYDFCSIMHYSKYEGPCKFTPKQKVSCHIMTQDNVFNINEIGQRTGLSDLDIKVLNQRYPCGGSLCYT